MQNNENQREIALLLDWENIRFGLQQRNLVPNISAIREEAESLGRVVVSRAYADFQNYALSNDPRRLYAAGIRACFTSPAGFTRAARTVCPLSGRTALT